MAQSSFALTLGNISVRQLDGLFSLNDLHKASGSNPSQRPGNFLGIDQTKALIAEIETAEIPAVTTREGRNGGTFACRELVIAYAAWISATFHLKVIRVFLDSAPPTTINPAQAQHLRELVELVVESGKQSHGETWARLHRKMHVNSYLALRPDQFDAACQYLRGKFDDTSIATLIQKHLPSAVALPAPQPQAMDVQTLCQLILGGIFTGQDFIKLAYAVNYRQFTTACNNPNRGYGEEVASKISGLSWADLHAINQKASMEVWLRSEIPAKAA